MGKRHPFPLSLRLPVDVVLAAHIAMAAAWWGFGPKGFPQDHPRFWTNEAIPVLVVVSGMVALAMTLRKRPRAPAIVLAAYGAGWTVGAIAARVLFPVSLGGGRWGIGLVPAAGCWGLAAFLARRLPRFPRTAVPAVLLASLLAVLTARWIRAPEPTTRPVDVVPTPLPVFHTDRPAPTAVLLGSAGRFQPGSGALVVRSGEVRLRVRPFLSFDRVSPDGCWSLLAPSKPPGERRRLAAIGDEGGNAVYEYSDGARALLPPNPDAVDVRLTATTPVPEPTDSHLNSFCALEVSGQARLSLSFSPCPETVVEVLPADDPTGRPARAAWLDASGRFSVVEATTGEKGPFRTLASGPMARHDALAITLHDEGRPVLRVVLDDWAAQASTDLSPTAGWGAPMNAIEFRRIGDDPRAPSVVSITLAATALGRGYDTVGHSPGTYRNRLTVIPLGD